MIAKRGFRRSVAHKRKRGFEGEGKIGARSGQGEKGGRGGLGKGNTRKTGGGPVMNIPEGKELLKGGKLRDPAKSLLARREKREKNNNGGRKGEARTGKNALNKGGGGFLGGKRGEVESIKKKNIPTYTWEAPKKGKGKRKNLRHQHDEKEKTHPPETTLKSKGGKIDKEKLHIQPGGAKKTNPEKNSLLQTRKKKKNRKDK